MFIEFTEVVFVCFGVKVVVAKSKTGNTSLTCVKMFLGFNT